MLINDIPELFSNSVYLNTNYYENYSITEKLISMFDKSVMYFNPRVVSIHTVREEENEEECKKLAKIYVLLCEASYMVEPSLGLELYKEANRTPRRLIFATIGENGMSEIKKILTKKGCQVYSNLEEIAEFINQQYKS